MKTVILCGGSGVRLKNSNSFIPKAMVKIGHRPLIWHVMKIYAKFGYTDFVLALGQGGDIIKDYFMKYDINTNDSTIKLGSKEITLHSQNQEKDWKITFVETGENSGTGARLFRCQDYIRDDNFFVAYADCLSNIDIEKLLESHKKHDKPVTVTGVMPPFRYGEFILKEDVAVDWHETSKLKSADGWVNGGFMVFKKEAFRYLEPFNECTLEKEVFSKLVKDRSVNIFKHDKFWQCLDNEREFSYLNSLCEKNMEYWLFV